MHPFSCALVRRTFLGSARFIALLLALSSGRFTRAAEPEPAPLVITSSGDFYNISEADKHKPQRIRLEFVVYYYDPYWKLLWGESQGLGFYLPVRGRELPMTSGQRVRIEGTIVPIAGISGDEVKVTVLTDKTPLTPLPTQGALADFSRFDAQWVSIEGYVCRQREVDPWHLQLDILSEGRLVVTRVMLGQTEPIPQLTGARVRINCVYVATRDPNGELRRIDGWSPRRSEVTLLGWLDSDPLFNRPQIAIEQLANARPDDWVHVAGEIWARDPDHSITLRDRTGQILIRTEQPAVFEAGETIEVVGHPTGRHLETSLSDPVFRIVPHGARVDVNANASRSEPLLKLRLAEQIMELRPEEAAQHYPAYLRGIVTWSDPKAGFFFLQDMSGGVRVQYGNRSDPPPPPGRIVAALGVSTNGVFAPELELKDLNVQEIAAYPPRRLVTYEQAITGSEEGKRIEMRGYLRNVTRSGMWSQMELTTAGGEFTANISAEAPIATLVGSMVRVTGVCTAVSNAQRQLTGVRLWVADAEAIEVEEPRSADPFTAPTRSVGSLRQFLAFHALDHHVRLTGVVLYNKPGRYLYLQQDNAGLLVLHRDALPLAAGEWIEVVGLPGRDGSRLVLREAVWRRAPPGRAPTPMRLEVPARLDADADGRLVTVRGRLHDHISDEGGHRLMIRAGDTLFEALVGDNATAALPRDGSVVELTGVYALEFDEYRRPRTFRLQLRDAGDIRVLEAPSWWTAQRALAIAGGFALCAALGIGWVVILRRRVRQQTAQIREQLENEARLNAELERATRLESLGVLAGGIAHDFNNLLTVIMANLGLAAMDERVQAAAGDIIADAERGARRAAELTQQLLTFAKGGDPVRRAVALPDVVREAAEFARHGSPVRCDIEVEPNLPPADVDRAQISRVVHNLVLNAAQAMSSGGVVALKLSAVDVADGAEGALRAGKYVKVTVRDDGPGIAAEHLARIFEPYFSTKPKNNGLGLATVHSIVKRHQGLIRVQSEIGRGTCFDVWLPVAKESPALAAPALGVPSRATACRVLFMDDEEVIRRTASIVLRQLGHEATIVADGADVVREYENALHAGRGFDVVVLDLTVPGGMGGRLAMEALRRIDPGVRGIVSSGYSNDPVLANYQAYGFCAVVPKPYEIADLARAIQDVAQGRLKVPGPSAIAEASTVA